MSDTGNERPAGWYYAEGDPDGTQRYWDGSAWQGGPQAAPLGAGGFSDAAFGDTGWTSLPGMSGDDSGYKGFFPTLFDFSLSSFLAPKVIRVLYIVGVVLICLFTVIGVIASFASGSAGGILLGLILVPLFGLLYLILIRIQTEFVIVAFRTYEETKKISANQR
jgi:hypothetical protein